MSKNEIPRESKEDRINYKTTTTTTSDDDDNNYYYLVPARRKRTKKRKRRRMRTDRAGTTMTAARGRTAAGFSSCERRARGGDTKAMRRKSHRCFTCDCRRRRRRHCRRRRQGACLPACLPTNATLYGACSEDVAFAVNDGVSTNGNTAR